MEKIVTKIIRKPDKSTKKHPGSSYETLYSGQNRVVCGIDEVGRGCLAGPLVVAALTLHTDQKHSLLRDSKLLNESELAEAYDWIVPRSTYAVAWGDHALIDQCNVYQATLKIMRRAYAQLCVVATVRPSVILVDAMPLTFDGWVDEAPEVVSLIKGESQSRSIAAASIVAKVTRDRMVRLLDVIIPGYYFSDHKGYGTVVHKNSLLQHGPSLLHRHSFLSHHFKKKDETHGRQQSFC